MEWQQLEYFRVVAKTEHFTLAAAHLSISQPTLSRSIAKLESELGTPLFDRVGRRVILNGAGIVFLPYVEQALGAMEVGKQEVQEVLHITQGTVSLGFFTTVGLSVVPELIRQFRTQYPYVSFQLTQNVKMDALFTQLKLGSFDLALCVSPADRHCLEWVQLFSEDLHVLIPSQHHLAGASSVNLMDLRNEPFILLKNGIEFRKLTDKLFLEAGFNPTVAFEGEELSMVVALVGAGLGVSIVPAITPIDVRTTLMLPIATPPSKSRAVGIGWKKDSNLSIAAKRFRDFTVERSSDIGLINVLSSRQRKQW